MNIKIKLQNALSKISNQTEEIIFLKKTRNNHQLSKITTFVWEKVPLKTPTLGVYLSIDSKK